MEAWQQIAFGAALVERMVPNYQLFCELQGEGAPLDPKAGATYASILGLVWESASGDNPSIDFQKQLDKLELITPDPEQYTVYGVWPALDAAVALATLLSLCNRFDSYELQSLLMLSQSSIEQYVDAMAESSNEAVDDEEHGLMLVEAQCIESLMQLLQAAGPEPRKARVKSLRVWAQSLGQSNIGIARLR
jgi:uncharacterized protein YjaG (DUF416 family)